MKLNILKDLGLGVKDAKSLRVNANMVNKLKSYLNVLRCLGVYIYRLIDYKLSYTKYKIKKFWGCNK